MKDTIYSIAYSFLKNSGIENYIIDTTAASEYSGKNLPDLSPRSLVKLPKEYEFSMSKTTDDFEQEVMDSKNGLCFLQNLHYLFSYLLLQEQNQQLYLKMLKAFCVLVEKSPYSKLRIGLASETILPFVQSIFNKNQFTQAWEN